MVVKFLSLIRELAGREKVQLQANNLEELIGKLSEKYGKKFEKRIWDAETKKLNDDIVILVNGKNLILLDGIKTILKEEDVVVIFPMAGGG